MTITNFPRTGQLLKYTDPEFCRFCVCDTLSACSTVATPVDLTDTRFQLDELQVSYDEGKVLIFSEIATYGNVNISSLSTVTSLTTITSATLVASPTFNLNQWVQLRMSLATYIDSGITYASTVASLVTYFTGRIRKRRRIGETNNEGFQYVAYGIQKLANEVVATCNGIPYVIFYSGTDVMSLGGAGYFCQPIDGSIETLFAYCNTSLSSESIPSTIGSPGTDLIGGSLRETCTLQNCKFVDGVNQLLQAAPSRRVFYDDRIGKWLFINVLNTDVEVIRLAENNVPNLEYEEDLSDRYTAMRLMVLLGHEFGVLPEAAVELTPDWYSSLQNTWCLQKALGPATYAGQFSEYAWVYRRWTIPDSVTEDIHIEEPMRIYIQVSHWGWTTYIPFAASIDWANKVAVTDLPAVIAGNPYHPGRSVGPEGAWLAYKVYQTASETLVIQNRYPTMGTSVTSMGSTVYTETWEGTAYSLYGIRREKREIVDITELGNASEKLSVYKDVVVSGEITVEGDPIPELINLQRRVTVTHSACLTGIESTPAVLMSYTYRFGKVGESILSLTTNKAPFVNAT